jgi:ABC-type glycerol-3-phosphate transport system substrate-binding protein
MKMRMLVPLTVVAVLLAACGGGDDGSVAPPTDEPAPAPGEVAITGAFGGDAQLEGGCAWLETAQGRYEVIYPEGYEVQYEPLQLVGPNGEVVASAGDRLTVTGVEAPDMASFCQVGTIFEATSVASG